MRIDKLLLFGSIAGLIACGQTGPLYLPGKPLKVNAAPKPAVQPEPAKTPEKDK